MSKPDEESGIDLRSPIAAASTAPGRRSARTRKRSQPAPEILRHGFYADTFSADEIRRLDALRAEALRAEALGPKALGSKALAGGSADEKNLLRIKILRLARLTPLKAISDKELDTLIKLVRVVAALDALERTQVMVRKTDSAADPLLQALAELDPEDL
jgi:hypothetical protein